MMYLRAIERKHVSPACEYYPFSVPAIASLRRLEFRSEVTFFAGENGSGKSTLLEGIAAGANSVTVRSDDVQTRRTLQHAPELADELRFEWTKRTRNGFFLRAEDFFDYTKGLTRTTDELTGMAEDYEHRFEGQALDLARGAVLGQRSALVQRYGGDPSARSHGEGFLHFFAARFTRPGLYLLDEPDTALSAQSVLGLISMIKALLNDGSQFIIATHSPMLLAFPGASILSFDGQMVEPIDYNDVGSVALVRDFLHAPDSYLRRL